MERRADTRELALDKIAKSPAPDQIGCALSMKAL
jgi:hypothetical protein